MLDADMEFIVDFETAEFAVYDVDIAKGRALELMLMLAELIKDSDGSEFTMGIDRGFTADDGSKASDDRSNGSYTRRSKKNFKRNRKNYS